MREDIRYKLQSQITGPFTTEEEVLGKNLEEIEDDLRKQLASFTKQIKMDIFQTKLKKGI